MTRRRIIAEDKTMGDSTAPRREFHGLVLSLALPGIATWPAYLLLASIEPNVHSGSLFLWIFLHPLVQILGICSILAACITALTPCPPLTRILLVLVNLSFPLRYLLGVLGVLSALSV